MPEESSMTMPPMRHGSIRPMSNVEVGSKVGEVAEVMQRIFQLLPDVENATANLNERLVAVLSPSKEVNAKNSGSPMHPVPLVQGLNEIYSRLAILHVELRELHSRIEL